MPQPEILLFDIMGTVVYDPFHRELPEHFGLDFDQLLERKHPTAWQRFERNEIEEERFCEEFFQGPESVDPESLRDTLRNAYRFIDGMKDVLEALKQSGQQMHAFSNYPIWYRLIEQELELSRYLDWTFVSCKTGHRKPEGEAYRYVTQRLGPPAEACLFVDDRSENCRAARDHGLRAIEFETAGELRKALGRHHFDL